MVVDVQINTSGASGGAAKAKGAFAVIEQDAARASASIQGQMNAVEAATGKSAKTFSMWGQAFKGAFIGAVAGITFSTIIGGITGIIEKTIQLGVESVKLAGDFQLARNAMTLFTGSASEGKAELAKLDELSAHTPGLRMLDARQGATNLRALGFEAKLVQDIVVGLAKQKLISGTTDEQAINRVIVNLQQLRAGSPQVMRDVRQMILALPSLSVEINKAFGSVEKFGAELRKDPKAALDKFAAGIANATAPAAGFNDALGKLEDAFIRAGTEFGEPILDPLIQDFKELSGGLDDNASVFKSWGQSVADAIQGASDAVRGFSELMFQIGVTDRGEGKGIIRKALGATAETVFNVAATLGTAGLYGLYQGSKAYGESERLKRPLGAERGGRFGTYAGDKIEEDRLKDQLAVTKSGTEARVQAIRNGLAVESAIRSSYLRDTTAQEMAYQKSMTRSKQQAIKDEIKAQTDGFNKEIELNKGDKNAIAEISAKGNQVLMDLQKDLSIEKANAMQKDRELERKSAEERRRDQLAFNELELRASKQRLDARTFDVEREIDITGRGYEKLYDIAKDSLTQTTDIISKNLALQLQDTTLTAQQRANIEKEAYLDIQDAAEEHRRKLADIEDRSFAETKRRIQEAVQFRQQASSANAGFFQSILGTLSPDIGFASTLPKSGLGSFSDQFKASMDLDVKGVISGALSIYEARANLLNKLHTNELEQIEAEIRANDDLLVIERERAEVTERNRLITLQNNQRDLERRLGGVDPTSIEGSSIQRDIDSLKILINSTQVNIDRISSGGSFNTISSGQLQSANRLLEMQKTNLETNYGIQVSQEKQALELKTINDLTREIANGGKDILIGKLTEIDLAKQWKLLVTEERQQLLDLSNESIVNSLRENELIKDRIALRNEEVNALFRIDKAQLDIDQKLVYSKNRADASVLEFLAQQKGITEIVSDVKINLLTTAYSGLDAVANRLTRSFGVFRDVIKDLIANLLKLALNSIFGKFFGSGAGTGSGGGINVGGIFGGGGSRSGGGINTGSIFGGSAGGGIFNFGGFGGGSTNQIRQNLGLPVTGTTGFGGLLGAGDQGLLGATGGGGVGTAGGGLLSGLTGAASGFLAGLPIFGAGIGSSLGGRSTGGKILGGIGGALAGVAALGGLLTAFAGTAVAGGVAGTLGVGLTASLLAAAPFAAVAAPLLIIGAILLGRNAKRRAEEKIHNQAVLDAFAGIDRLIEDVNADRIDGVSAITQAEAIKQKYIETASGLKDKKTRNHALADVSRIDSRIATLKTAVDGQTARQKRLELTVPTFAAGGAVSPGFQHGGSQVGYFPGAGSFARFNEAGSEYILDAETTRNVGVANLDSLRASKGQSFASMRSYASGGYVAPPQGAPSSQGITLELNVNVGLSTDSFVQVVSSTIKGNDGSREQLKAIVTTLKDEGQHELAKVLGDMIKKGN